MNENTKANYNFMLAIAFIGIGSWKMYDHFYGVELMETYQVVLAGLLIAFGFFQLYRWWKARQESDTP
ncbi:hypothetical protein [Nonlabens antarcticus]|uniref:hypothetical protein n=1 Tax=Nonlabens antarcticus TaxID=392714 RepID=UPI00189176F0|nr:hypothetical protein [Nonlabens antarcticus]